MPSWNQIGTAVVIAVGTLCATQVAIAAESGAYQLVGSYTHDFTRFDFANQKIVSGPLHGTMTVTQSSGGPFVVGESTVAVCVVYGKKSDAGMDLEAPCTQTDTSGDKLFTLSKRNVGDTDTGGGGDGRAQIIGGTGKYVGITGSCTYTADYLSDNRLVAINTCEWQTP
ncbi:MAG: hypothetical protein QF759_01420 [Alphaproteobacteria bacterium]|jgi:hypothetical protein|nr:hypothetical protein [Alphaproteobacteria bacterium]